MLADLHVHTTESDGTWTPREVVWEANQLGLSALAITDHDTTAGLEEAKKHAPGGLEVIQGIELSTVADKNGEEIHILGLWIDPSYEELQDELAIFREDRLKRTGLIVQRLRDLGISLTYDDVTAFAQKDVLSRSHIASALLAKGFVATKQEAFATLIGQDGPAYVERRKMTPERGISLILASGGVPILAHPGMLKDLTVLPTLVEAGLVGLEVVHSTHSSSQVEYFSELALNLGLLPSGGSDCHGPGGKDQVYLGKFSIPLQWVTNLRAKRG